MRSLDIVRDVVNLVPVHWAATQVAGLSLKTINNPHGAHTELEMYQMLAVIFEYVRFHMTDGASNSSTRFMFLNTRPHAGWTLREQSKHFSSIIVAQIKTHIEEIVKGSLSLASARDALVHWLVGQDDHAHDFLRTLVKMNTNASTDELAYSVLGTIVAGVPGYGQGQSPTVRSGRHRS